MKLEYVLTYPGALVAILSVIALMIRRRLPDGWGWAIAGLGVLLVGFRLISSCLPPVQDTHDIHIFWDVGHVVRAGQDPYSPRDFFEHPFLNPPTALPIFAAFSLVPFEIMVPAWKAFINLVALGLIPLAYWALKAQGETKGSTSLSAAEIGCVAAAFAISDAATADAELGQLGALTALVLTLAVWAQGRRRPIVAGLCLAIATVKVGTMLPVLLLFLRRSDIKTWATLIIATAVLCLLPGHVGEFPTRLHEMLTHLRELSTPGQPNDITFRSPLAVSIVGFEHAAYRLGLHDLRQAALVQFAALGLIGALLAAVVLKAWVSRPAACALVMLYAFLFLYHRLYDALILAIPFAYAIEMTKGSQGWRRLAFGSSTILMLAVLYMRRKPLQAASEWSMHHGLAGRIVQAIVLPYATWAVLLAMLCLLAASWQKRLDANEKIPE